MSSHYLKRKAEGDLMVSRWFWSSLGWDRGTSDPVEQQVAARNTLLAENAQQVGNVTRISEELLACYKAQKVAFPIFFETLSKPQHPPTLSDSEMIEDLRLMVMALTTDLSGLGQELDKIRQRRELMEQLVTIWEKVETNIDSSLAHLGATQRLDEKIIQDLSAVLAQISSLGVQPTCRAGSRPQ
ncbi:MAG: hypothetical protein JSS10_09100 [Verrucomicrobia bacterium]|nr:hypothetical protein [Verrucomicrobiota bacterium]